MKIIISNYNNLYHYWLVGHLLYVEARGYLGTRRKIRNKYYYP